MIGNILHVLMLLPSSKCCMTRRYSYSLCRSLPVHHWSRFQRRQRIGLQRATRRALLDEHSLTWNKMVCKYTIWVFASKYVQAVHDICVCLSYGVSHCAHDASVCWEKLKAFRATCSLFRILPYSASGISLISVALIDIFVDNKAF